MQAHTSGELETLCSLLLNVYSWTFLPIFLEISSCFIDPQHLFETHCSKERHMPMMSFSMTSYFFVYRRSKTPVLCHCASKSIDWTLQQASPEKIKIKKLMLHFKYLWDVHLRPIGTYLGLRVRPVDGINFAIFYGNRLRDLDSWGVEFWQFPLNCDVAVNTEPDYRRPVICSRIGILSYWLLTKTATISDRVFTCWVHLRILYFALYTCTYSSLLVLLLRVISWSACYMCSQYSLP